MKKIAIFSIIAACIIIFSCEPSTYQEIGQDTSATTTDTTTGTTSGTTTGTTSGTTTGTTSSTTTGTTTGTTTSITYTTNVKPIITNNCISCHYSGGQSPALATYTQVKNATSAGSLLCTIQAQACRTMPPSGKMSQANIDLILLWKTQGYLQ